MFETWPIEVLQRAGSEAWTAVAVALTALGYRAAFVPALVLVAFGVHLRRGFALIQLTVGTALATVAVKAMWLWPRPFQVTHAVRALDPWVPGGGLFVGGGGAHGWLSPLPGGAVEAFRGLAADAAAGVGVVGQEVSGGFPSGHAAMAVALWGGAALLFGPRFPPALAAAAILLIPATRIYLGVHFVGDVVAGWLLGALVLGAAAAVRLRAPAVRGWLDGVAPFRVVRPAFVATALAPFALMPWLTPGPLAAWAGLHLGLFGAAGATGSLPAEGGSAVARAARAGVALLLFALVSIALRRLLVDLPDGAAKEIAENLPPAYLLFHGGLAIGRRAGWFRAAGPDR